jgi:uncharacterized protein YecT (DUF1311 family)
MKSRAIRILACGLFCLAALRSGHTQHLNEADSPCAKAVITSEVSACLVDAYKSSDAILNTVYGKVRAKLDAGELKQLTKTQELWIRYRDANCAAERDLYGSGTGAFPAYEACLGAMTRARTAELHVTYAVRLKD